MASADCRSATQRVQLGAIPVLTSASSNRTGRIFSSWHWSPEEPTRVAADAGRWPLGGCGGPCHGLTSAATARMSPPTTVSGCAQHRTFLRGWRRVAGRPGRDGDMSDALRPCARYRWSLTGLCLAATEQGIPADRRSAQGGRAIIRTSGAVLHRGGALLGRSGQALRLAGGILRTTRAFLHRVRAHLHTAGASLRRYGELLRQGGGVLRRGGERLQGDGALLRSGGGPSPGPRRDSPEGRMLSPSPARGSAKRPRMSSAPSEECGERPGGPGHHFVERTGPGITFTMIGGWKSRPPKRTPPHIHIKPP